MEHVEKGLAWSSLLDRHFKLCMAASKRGVGPRRKAAEVPEDTWAKHSLLEDPWKEGLKVGLASHLFACSVHWMMREIELAALSADDVRFDADNRLASVIWRESKQDTETSCISRTLQCPPMCRVAG